MLFNVYVGDVLINKATQLPLNKTQIFPKISCDNCPLHAIVMHDPDASPARGYLHWLTINDRQTVVHYKFPSPPAGTGPHHYNFYLLQQPSWINLTQDDIRSLNNRTNFDLTEFMKRYNMTLLKHVYFITEHLN